MKGNGKRQFWITTPQLAALGVITLSLAALAFFLGLMVGRGQASSGDRDVVAEANPGLVTSDVESDTITELLARVEQAAEKHRSQPELAFPEALVEEELQPRLPQEQPVEETAPMVVAADAAPAEAQPDPPTEEEEVSEADVPSEGWAVQVASYPTSEEAQRHLASLKSDGHNAYLIAALVKGQTWYRVRVGPYSTRDIARSAQASLSQALGRSDLLVTGVQ